MKNLCYPQRVLRTAPVIRSPLGPGAGPRLSIPSASRGNGLQSAGLFAPHYCFVAFQRFGYCIVISQAGTEISSLQTVWSPIRRGEGALL
jgi:hypothetical protein